MKKLKNKIFWVIWGILTIFLLSILFIFNYQDYKNEKTNIETNLMRMEENKNDKFKPDELKNIDEKEMGEEQKAFLVFMDVVAYTIIYNDQNEVIDILNHTQKDISDDEIKDIAKKILDNPSKENMKIGNLYFEKFSYSFKGHNSLTIIDNMSVKTKLINLIKTSIIIFVLLEIVIILISLRITNWIIKPVIESFNKQKQFITDASHELKTPLAVIMANAEALEREPDEEKWLYNIKTESERMNELITELLNLAKLENEAKSEIYDVEDLSKITLTGDSYVTSLEDTDST